MTGLNPKSTAVFGDLGCQERKEFSCFSDDKNALSSMGLMVRYTL